MFQLIVGAFLLPRILSLTPEVPPATVDLRQKELPADWKLDEIRSGTPSAEEKGNVTVVVWELIHFDDDLPMKQRCLVVKKLESPIESGKKFLLAYLTRMPLGPNKSWRAIDIPAQQGTKKGAGPIQAYELFESVPTNEELKKFLASRNWDRDISPRLVTIVAGRGAREGQNTRRDVFIAPTIKDGGLILGNWKKVFERNPPAGLFPELVVPNKKE